MSRAGRKRKEGERHPGGKLVQVGRHVPAPGLIRRAVEDAFMKAAKSDFGTELGRMRLRGIISDRQMSAGLSFAALFHRYALAMGFPSHSPKAIDLQRGSPGQDNRPEDDEEIERVNRVRIAYQRVAAALHQVGSLEIAVNVCVDDVPPAWFEQKRLSQGLDVLTVCFHI